MEQDHTVTTEIEELSSVAPDGLSTQEYEGEDGYALTVPLNVHMSIMATIGGLGLLGNGLVLLVFWRYPELRTSSAAPFVILQATVDMISSIVTFFQEVIFNYRTANYMVVHSYWVCKVLGSGLLFWLSTEASTISLVLLTANRYLKIVHPFSSVAKWSSRKVALVVSVPWMLTAVWTTFTITWTSDLHRSTCLSQWFYPTLVITFTFTFSVLFFAFPVTLFVYCYVRILLVLQKREAVILGIPDSCTRDFNIKKHRAEVQLTVTMTVVCLAFFLCWAPITISLIIRPFIQPNKAIDDYIIVPVFLAYFNCCTNPIIYGFRYRGFRKGLKNLFTISHEKQPSFDNASPLTVMK